MTTRAQIELVGAPRPRRVVPLSLLSDEALADRVATEGERAFEVIYRRHRQRLYAHCAAVLRHPEDAEEALQSAMLGAYRALRDAPGREMSLRPWLHRIAHNQCIDVIRRRPAGCEPLSDIQASRDPGPAERSETAEALARLRDDLRSLPHDQREALVLRELSGLSHAEIGAALGEGPARVKQLIHQARRGLSRMAEGRELACPEVRARLSDADGRVTRAQGLGAHIRACGDCRRFRREIAERPAQLAALAPVLPVAAAERIMAALQGGGAAGGAAGGGALAGGAGSGVLSAVGGALASKAAIVTAVTVVGAIAVAPVARPSSTRITVVFPVASRSSMRSAIGARS
ncbi:MAG TPA: sigma-70 family RNA polymerase sigma factor [Miltoncostaeaceae bacterium]|nr:sigma-70 family RNA polymerase sigma factor [Miltoncostaeaceae bacterium]